MKFSADCKSKSCCLLLRNNLGNCLMSPCFSMKKYKLGCCGAHKNKNQPGVAGRCWSLLLTSQPLGLFSMERHKSVLWGWWWTMCCYLLPARLSSGMGADLCVPRGVPGVWAGEAQIRSPVPARHRPPLLWPKGTFHLSLLLTGHTQLLWSASHIHPEHYQNMNKVFKSSS